MLNIDEQIEVLVNDIEESKKSLDTLRHSKGEVNQEALLESISKAENELESLESDLTKHSTNLQRIEKYKEYQASKKAYEGWIMKRNDLELQEKEDRLKYAAASNLLDKILEAESISILTIINSINTHAQLYLDHFFTDNPISIKLLTFKESKKSVSKPQINLAIEYKGMECDTSTLSGGELARVVLAFTLALAEMFNTPLILLDECTASLDESLSTAIINSIKDNFSNKLVIVISHQNVCGIYDRNIMI
jgi:DNA repair exonuclease SbcCD ATPase subunit